MHVPPTEDPKIQPQEHLPISGQDRVTELEEVKGKLAAAEDTVGVQRATIDSHAADINRLRGSRNKYLESYQSAREQVEESKRENGKLREAYEEALRKQDQRIRAVEDELARTKELLVARSMELSGAQSFLSTADRLSETEVLSIVRDLNENVFQVAANLTEEWEMLGPSRSTRFNPTKEDLDRLSEFYGSPITHQVFERESTAVTFLLQSCLCRFATEIATGWRYQHDTEYKILGFIYQGLSASEGQPVLARWRSLTHSHLPEPASHSAVLAQFLAEVLWLTGTFSSEQRSFEFVQAKAFKGIETIDRLATRLESVFMVDIASGDMTLLFVPPRTEFNGASMSSEFESDGSATPRGQDKAAGTTEVGVRKRVGNRGEGLRTKVLLKAKVVLERDIVAS